MRSEPLEDLNKQLASRLTELRQQKDWSLERLSAECGVSRASLSRLEKGEVSATAEMLAKICSAYGLALSRLIMMTEENFPAHVTAQEQPVWQDPQTGFVRHSVSPPCDQLSGEVLKCHLPPGACLQYEVSPAQGLEHHLVMTEGALKIAVDDVQYDLSSGDCLRYFAHGSTRFNADPHTGAKYLLIMVS